MFALYFISHRVFNSINSEKFVALVALNSEKFVALDMVEGHKTVLCRINEIRRVCHLVERPLIPTIQFEDCSLGKGKRKKCFHHENGWGQHNCLGVYLCCLPLKVQQSLEELLGEIYNKVVLVSILFH